PFELWRADAQIERKGPAAENDVGLGKQMVALLARPLPQGFRREIARDGVGGPGLAILAVEPAARIASGNRRIRRFGPFGVGAAQPLDDEDVDVCHRQRLLAPICAVALISTFNDGVAKAAT